MLEKTLAEHTIFSSLDASQITIAARAAIHKSYSDGAWITHQGTVWPYLFLVQQGKVQAIKESPEGRSLLVAEFQEKEVFWGIGFFLGDAPMPVALVAKGDTELYLWRVDDLKPTILKNGGFSWELVCLMIQRMQFASGMLDDFAFQPTTGRLAGVLLDHFQEAVDEYVARDMTLDEMAARIGSTREMVCRHLYQFADQGVIQINRTELKILDQDTLKNLAGKDKD
jgi:CRP/FNR family transcriptional regulator